MTRGGKRPGAGAKPGPPPKPPDERYVAITVRLHPDDLARLRRLAAHMGVSYGRLVADMAEQLERRITGAKSA